MTEKTVAIIGSTGMIGQYLLESLLTDTDFERIRILVRRPMSSPDPKVEVKLVDFNDAESVKLALDGVETLFCAIGTTQKKVKGNREQYAKIDFDIPVKSARLAREVGCKKFITVTSVGASSKSGNFYLKLKGHVEDALKLVELEAVHIMRPSVLLGNRKESRPAEKILQGAMKLSSPILLGSWVKYKAIHGRTVAKAMIQASKKQEQGFFVYEYRKIIELAK